MGSTVVSLYNETLTICVERVVVLSDEIDAKAEVLFVENVPFEVFLETCRVVLDKSVRVERIADELRVERNVR